MSWWNIGAAAVSAVGSAVSSKKSAKSAIQAEELQNANNLNKVGYSKAMEDWSARAGRQESRMGLEGYNQNSSIQSIAPGYSDVYKPAVVGAPPTADTYLATKASLQGIVPAQQRASLDSIGKVVIPGG